MAIETYNLYHYDPSLVAAVAATVCFGVVTALHLIRLLIGRIFFFTPFVIGGIFETVGYIGRVINSKETPNWATGPYIMQSLLLLVAPAFFAASIYITLGRIIVFTDGHSRSPIPGRWITRTFVVGDIISFFVQAGGGGLLAQAKTAKSQKVGKWIIVAGLGIQIVFFAVFILISAIFHFRMVTNPPQGRQVRTMPWQRFLYVLYVANGLILGRSAFRMVEFLQGTNGALQAHEFWLYIFDGALMFIMMVILLIFHPSRILSSKKCSGRGTRRRRRKRTHSKSDRRRRSQRNTRTHSRTHSRRRDTSHHRYWYPSEQEQFGQELGVKSH
ncbi:unnamed protein product [Penicillium salamii]|uniref:RTA-like protein n=1 Tax=Penicillium salamii TaxID=1612424 RepID=A0A9W4J7S9_9EURO|nr:unnamed protein product [Penicillium salamii]CAG8188345.1 unnamed protein product [Penicillium salamii]CAG8371221.1 unnamed protein product [Penicillium salamii]CAG8376131.1 unnamed protein product [Penicillium salamii]CAG8378671.1 unnamed protein product [Penicillium salamii]